MRLGVLLRVSTDKQDESRQRRTVRNYFSEKDWGLPPDDLWFVDKEARDQSQFRSEFQRMLKLVQAHKLDAVIIEKFDRFGVQDVDEWFYYRYLFRTSDCKLISVTDGELTTKDIPTMIKTFFMADQSENEQVEKARRVLDGQINKAIKADLLNGIPPYGYDKACYDATGALLWILHYVTPNKGIQIFPCDKCKAKKRTTKNNKPCLKCRRIEREGNDLPRKAKTEKTNWIPSEDQSRIDLVRHIYKWYTENTVGFAKVSQWCNDHGFLYYGHFVDWPRVRDIVKNPAYAGDYAFFRTSKGRFYTRQGDKAAPVPLPPGGKRKKRHINLPDEQWLVREGAWCPLIDKETWIKARKKRQADKQNPRKKPKDSEAWLSGVLVCGHCNVPLTCRHVKGRVRYYCYTYSRPRRKSDQKDRPCSFNPIWHDEAEALIVNRLQEFRIELAQCNDREAILKMYEARGEKHDLLARTIARGVTHYADTLREVFEINHSSKSTLAKLLNRLCPNEYSGWALNLASREFLNGRPDSPWPASEMAELIAEVEKIKIGLARQQLDQVQAEHRQLVKAKAFAESELERKAQQSLIVELEDRIADLEEHLVPIVERRDEILTEIKLLEQRIADAERILVESEGYRKAEAVRQVFSEVRLFWEHYETPDKRKRGTSGRRPNVKCRLLPEKTEFCQNTNAGANSRW